MNVWWCVFSTISLSLWIAPCVLLSSPLWIVNIDFERILPSLLLSFCWCVSILTVFWWLLISPFVLSNAWLEIVTPCFASNLLALFDMLWVAILSWFAEKTLWWELCSVVAVTERCPSLNILPASWARWFCIVSAVFPTEEIMPWWFSRLEAATWRSCWVEIKPCWLLRSAVRRFWLLPLTTRPCWLEKWDDWTSNCPNATMPLSWLSVNVWRLERFCPCVFIVTFWLDWIKPLSFINSPELIATSFSATNKPCVESNLPRSVLTVNLPFAIKRPCWLSTPWALTVKSPWVLKVPPLLYNVSATFSFNSSVPVCSQVAPFVFNERCFVVIFSAFTSLCWVSSEVGEVKANSVWAIKVALLAWILPWDALTLTACAEVWLWSKSASELLTLILPEATFLPCNEAFPVVVTVIDLPWADWGSSVRTSPCALSLTSTPEAISDDVEAVTVGAL